MKRIPPNIMASMPTSVNGRPYKTQVPASSSPQYWYDQERKPTMPTSTPRTTAAPAMPLFTMGPPFSVLSFPHEAVSSFRGPNEGSLALLLPPLEGREHEDVP